MDWGEKLAIAAEAGVAPEQFWRLTPWEFWRSVEGYRRRQRFKIEGMARLALFARAAVWSKGSLTMRDLLGPGWYEDEGDAALSTDFGAGVEEFKKHAEKLERKARDSEVAQLETRDKKRKR